MKMTLIETLKKHVTFGNSKLPKSTMIFNMGSAMDCPSAALSLCVNCKICYAKKAERMYPACKPYRDRQADIWKNNFMDDLAVAFEEIIKSKRTKITALRFNESGDLWTQECVTKIEFIAKHLYEKLGVIVYGYTARKDLDFSGLKYAKVRGSNFHKEGLTGTFDTVDKPSGNNPVCLGDCKKCSLCASYNGTIEVIKH